MVWRALGAVAACLSLAHATLAAEPLFDASRPLQIADQGVFSIAGRYVQTEAGTIMVGQMYVQYQVPKEKTRESSRCSTCRRKNELTPRATTRIVRRPCCSRT